MFVGRCASVHTSVCVCVCVCTCLALSRLSRSATAAGVCDLEAVRDSFVDFDDDAVDAGV